MDNSGGVSERLSLERRAGMVTVCISRGMTWHCPEASYLFLGTGKRLQSAENPSRWVTPQSISPLKFLWLEA